MENLDELKKLTKYLRDNNYIVHTYDEYHPYGRHSVAVFNSNGECLWDAICQYGSYGYERGNYDRIFDWYVVYGGTGIRRINI